LGTFHAGKRNKMSDRLITIINESRSTDIEATIEGGRVSLTAAAVETALGWALKPEGFCRDDACVPVREGSRAVVDGEVDLAGLADLLGLPLALDVEHRAAALGEAPEHRAAALATLEAPDFTLPGLDGRMHTLSAHREKKVFLAVWASW
jgi:hypothetical protein